MPRQHPITCVSCSGTRLSGHLSDCPSSGTPAQVDKPKRGIARFIASDPTRRRTTGKL